MRDEEQIHKYISKRLRELRLNHPKSNVKTTQAQLANACKIDRATLTNIELGNQRPPIVVIYRICNYFGIGLDDLLPDLASIYDERSTSIEIGGQSHKIGGEKTAQVVEDLLKKRA